ncbi:MAG: nucleoside deaminase [Bacteroidales bacterium]|jgi:tRNA(adenine34) deaminase|nr:nucleoside deaminase [Bacteroidales bacterium]
MQQKDDVYFMNLALEQAKEAASIGEVPVGAVIVCNEKIIARSFNMTERLNDATAHAEMQAFTAAMTAIGGKYLNQCTLYVTLEPCPMCCGAAFWTQIGRIVFGAKDERRIFGNVKELYHPKTVVKGGVMERECSQILKTFFKNKRNRNK